MPRGGKPINITGQRFGRLVALEYVGSGQTGAMWRAWCDCGAEVVTASKSLRRGATTSCGCFRSEAIAERLTRHGHSVHGRPTPTYSSWAAAKGRCGNPRNQSYAEYGGRGIRMAATWAASFAIFLADMGEKPPGTTLERIDNDGPYEPGNCRWATRKEQANNRRPWTKRNERKSCKAKPGAPIG